MEELQQQLRELTAQVRVLSEEKSDLQADLDDANAAYDELEAQSGFAEARALKDEALARSSMLEATNEELRREKYRLESQLNESEAASEAIRRELDGLRENEVKVTHSNTNLMKQLEMAKAELERCVGRAWRSAARVERPGCPCTPPCSII